MKCHLTFLLLNGSLHTFNLSVCVCVCVRARARAREREREYVGPEKLLQTKDVLNNTITENCS